MINPYATSHASQDSIDGLRLSNTSLLIVASIPGPVFGLAAATLWVVFEYLESVYFKGVQNPPLPPVWYVPSLALSLGAFAVAASLLPTFVILILNSRGELTARLTLLVYCGFSALGAVTLMLSMADEQQVIIGSGVVFFLSGTAASTATAGCVRRTMRTLASSFGRTNTAAAP